MFAVGGRLFRENARANKWLALFVFILGTAFIANHLEKVGAEDSFRNIVKIINSLQFLLAPSLFIAILFFVNPTRNFKIRYCLHFLPFAVFTFFEKVVFRAEKSVGTKMLFAVGDFESWVRDLQPFLVSGYIAASFRILKKHGENLKNIASETAFNTAFKKFAGTSPTELVSKK